MSLGLIKHQPLPEKTPAELRAHIVALEASMFAMPERQVSIKTTHHFCDGVYAREIFVPAGVTIVGKIHKFPHLSVLSQGEMMVLTDEGMRTLRAPATIHAKPGIKRVGYAVTDCVWTTFHATRETDPDVIEAQVTANSFSEIEGEKPCLGLR